MCQKAIVINHLSKRYEIGLRKRRQDTLRDLIVASFQNPFSRKKTVRENTIWALKDVSFDVNPGEAIGIIGRNGAGKSTLLKILSQITEPTEGRVVINGRVGALLEVGTGFHWELTGRENIYLNGAILGMTRREIQQRFDEIVEFAGIEKFLDTPVKRYSSGMFVRLGFSVAAHLEPEILVVDEVLAVGDTEFQKRCLGKMDDVASQGRTVIFVSHNMNVIQRLCNRTLLLENGKVKTIGKTSDVIKAYIDGGVDTYQPNQWININNQNLNISENNSAFPIDIFFSSNNQDQHCHLYPDGPLEIRLKIYSDSSRKVNSLAVSIYDPYGAKLINADIIRNGQQISLNHGLNDIIFRIPQLHLKPGIYTLGLWLSNSPSQVFYHNDQVIKIEVIDVDTARLGRRPSNDGVVTCEFTCEHLVK